MFCKYTTRKKKQKRYSTNRAARDGVALVEFAVCLPLLVLVCFGSIQLSSTILLRHQAVAILEIATLDYMLGNVPETDLPAHIAGLTRDFNITGEQITVTQVDQRSSGADTSTFLEVELSVPVAENIWSAVVINGSHSEVSTKFLVYRPQ